jgi:hypothetical protein
MRNWIDLQNFLGKRYGFQPVLDHFRSWTATILTFRSLFKWNFWAPGKHLKCFTKPSWCHYWRRFFIFKVWIWWQIWCECSLIFLRNFFYSKKIARISGYRVSSEAWENLYQAVACFFEPHLIRFDNNAKCTINDDNDYLKPFFSDKSEVNSYQKEKTINLQTKALPAWKRNFKYF